MIQKYWGQPGCLCLHYIKRTNDGAPLPDSSAIFQRMKKGLCTNAYFSLTRQPHFLCFHGTGYLPFTGELVDKYALQAITVAMIGNPQSITVVTEDIPVFCQTCCTISCKQCPYIR